MNANHIIDMGGGQYLSLLILLLVPIVRVDYNVCRRVSALPCELKIEDNPAWAWVNFGTVLVLVVSVTLTATSLACPRPSNHSRRTLFNRQATVSINTFMLVYLQHLFITFHKFQAIPAVSHVAIERPCVGRFDCELSVAQPVRTRQAWLAVFTPCPALDRRLFFQAAAKTAPRY